MKCVNCDKPALYVYEITSEIGYPYCATDLPRFLRPRLLAGNLKTTAEWKDLRDNALEQLSANTEVANSKRVKAKPDGDI